MSDTTSEHFDEASEGESTSGEVQGSLPPMTAHKAWAGGIVSTLIAFLTPLKFAMENGITGAEWVDIATFTIIGAAAGFGITYVVPNRAK